MQICLPLLFIYFVLNLTFSCTLVGSFCDRAINNIFLKDRCASYNGLLEPERLSIADSNYIA